MKSLSVVIPNFNGRALLQENLPPLLAALGRVDAEWEVIVVDDASSDDSVSFLNDSHPMVRLLVNEENRGFADSVNRGIFAARYDVVMSLNSDVKVEEDVFPLLLDRFDRPDIFAIAPSMIDPRDGRNQASYRLIPGVCWFVDRCPQNFTPGELAIDYPLFFASGGACCYDRQKLVTLGGFPTIYAPFYVEDVDLSYQAWKRGWQSLLEPRATVWHHSSATIKKYVNYRKIRFITARNKHMFLWINITDRWLTGRYFLCLLPSLLWDIVKFRKYKFVGMFMALTRLPEIIKERKRRKAHMLCTDSEIIARVRLLP